MVSILDTLATQTQIPIWLMVIVVIWSLVWKALALWKSASRHQVVWFVALIFINTLGILEMLYIFIFSNIKLPNVKTPKQKKRR